MSISEAKATWEGNLTKGNGTMKPAHAADVPFSLGTRFEGKQGSNPEELVGAALAGCFSMALSLGLEKAGLTPQSIQTSAKVHLEKVPDGFEIKKIELTTDVRATGGDAAKITSVAEETKKACPVGKVLRAAEITLKVNAAS
jgi:osmotically inducible protein OsmC